MCRILLDATKNRTRDVGVIMIKKLSGGSGSICRVIDNKYVIKSAHTDQARKKIKQQIAFLQANPKTVYPEKVTWSI